MNMNGPSPEFKRAATRGFILDHLVQQRHGEGDIAGQIAAAFLWLVAGSPAGEFLAKPNFPYTRFHYEITDIEADNGCRGQNFRLVLGAAEEPPPDIMQTAAPAAINMDCDVHPLWPIDTAD